ncbi:MAG TPA: 16S rRNA (cytidine(1402)-2'-O)-methyltransferase [Bacteroidia bacterium]|nr:16S rRNA (cytidine(1402)-2'-O)-methyltransferase [Bacteroidia bacterium]HQF28093.1 16S rRNA (cytidine(1402)-2'-O)-methyltransferase [Bacteroidia bacterium]HQK97350.1 16S rRNA (cytidine(1402)-2'-O)-methyltransferase [Bacteroidia bacterium]
MLTLVPTPIGNLQDITLRALEVLKSVDIVLAEDTRTARFLLQHFQIEKRILSHHQHNEHQALKEVIRLLQEGNSMALVSDAGTPAVSDPGYLLVRECIKEGIEVQCLPGPTAFVPAMVMSGLPCDRFVFEGFLPQKKGRQTRIQALRDENRTMVFYESPFRLVKLLDEAAVVFGEDRQASVSRELSKMFEETKRGTLKELSTYFTEKGVKGEIVVCIGGKPEKSASSKHEEEE